MADWDDEVDQALAVLSTPGKDAAPASAQSRPSSHILGIYAWNPALMRGWLPFSNHLRNSSLPDRIREMAIIRTAWLGRGEYEWAQHVRMSRAGGFLTDAELDALGSGPDDQEWSPEDAAVVRAVDDMVLRKNVSNEVWQQLEKRFDRQQLIDLVFTVGTYDMHSMAFATLGLQLEPGMQRFADNTSPEQETS